MRCFLSLLPCESFPCGKRGNPVRPITGLTGRKPLDLNYFTPFQKRYLSTFRTVFLYVLNYISIGCESYSDRFKGVFLYVPNYIFIRSELYFDTFGNIFLYVSNYIPIGSEPIGRY